MNKWKFFLFIIFMGVSVGFAQQKMEIQGSGSSLYLDHTVSPQETFYSIGRLYNVSPRDLASFNKIQMDRGLAIGQRIKIPLDKNNFDQSEVKSVLDFHIPLYHTVKQGETLFRLGANYNKVSLESIKKWNHLTSETVSVGVPLIVGFLKVDKNQSALAKDAPAPVVEEPVRETAVVQETTHDTNSEVTSDTNAQNAVTVQPARETESQSTLTVKTSNIGSGYFKQAFDASAAQKHQKDGSAGVFKSTSGWQDGKFYCFNNEAAPGSVVKVTDPETGKSVYAKVLDAIPDIKQNNGLVVIVSNSAAEELGKGEEQFNCTVTYEK